MATRSPTQFHSYWGQFGAAADLPNVAAAPTQDAALQAGDIAFVTGDGFLYLCTDPTLGAAVWIAMSVGGLGDVRTARTVVGNAPNGDTNATCDFLDPGDGSGIATAIAALPADSDLFIKAGLYDLGAGAEAGPFTIPAGVRVWAAGKGSRGTEILMKANNANQTAFILGAAAELHDIRIRVPAPTVAVAGAGVVLTNADCIVEGVAIDMSGVNYLVANYANQGLRFAFRLGGVGNSGAPRAIFDKCQVIDAPRFYDDGGPGTIFAGYGTADLPGAAAAGCTLNDCFSEGGDAGVHLDGTGGAGTGQRAKIQGIFITGAAQVGILINEVGETSVQGGVILMLNDSGQFAGFSAIRIRTNNAAINNHNIHGIHSSFSGAAAQAGRAVHFQVAGAGTIREGVVTGCTFEEDWDVGVELDAGVSKVAVGFNTSNPGASATTVDNGTLNEVAHNPGP